MQVRCYNCHRPFAIGKQNVHNALDVMHEDDLNHYNAQCPFCRRANRISKEELIRAAPDWEPSKDDGEKDE